jgi:hypothetical protein
MKKLLSCVVLILPFIATYLLTSGQLGRIAEQKNMALVGFNDLQARSAYQPLPHKYPDGRWIFFSGHHAGTAFNPLTGQIETNGVSIVDVTNPKKPVYLAHIPGPPGSGELGGSQMVRVCDGKDLPKGNPNKVYLLRPFGNENQQIYDVTNPASPTLVTNLFSIPRSSTHKSDWECSTGIAYVVAGAVAEGWKSGHITSIFDLSDPHDPKFIRHYALDGHQPGSPLPAPAAVHGPISAYPLKDRVYFAFGVSSNGVMQVVDRKKLIEGDPALPCNTTTCTGPGERFEPTSANLKYPEIGRLDMNPNWGGHTSFPVLEVPIEDYEPNAPLPSQPPNPARTVRDFVVLVSESTANGCNNEFRHFFFMVDVTTESKPQVVSNWQVRESEGNYCDRGGRFGAHASNEQIGPPFYKKIVFVSWFNAGVRGIDIRDPFNPKEVAFYIPPTTDNTDFRCNASLGQQLPNCPRPIQTNNVETDERGYIYIVDRANTGLHILQLTGAARKVLEE